MADPMLLVIKTIWLFLPAAIANMMPIFAARYRWFAWLAVPVHERLLGSHKTWRGFMVGIFAGGVVGYLQFIGEAYLPLPAAAMLALGPRSQYVFVGMMLALGALVGDSLKSLVKRQAGMAAGKLWLPWDQIDYVIGASVVAFFLTDISLTLVATALVLFGFGSLLTSYVGVKLKMKDSL